MISNNKRPINTPGDLEGLKLRTPGSKTRILAFQELGAAPTPMNLGEVYLALKQGALDGQENPLSVVKEFSFFEVQKYVSITRHVYTPITLTMHGKTWDSLSAELQDAAKAAAVDAAAETRRLSAESDASLVSEFEAQGVAVNQADVESFKAVTGPIYEKNRRDRRSGFLSRRPSRRSISRTRTSFREPSPPGGRATGRLSMPKPGESHEWQARVHVGRFRLSRQDRAHLPALQRRHGKRDVGDGGTPASRFTRPG